MPSGLKVPLLLPVPDREGCIFGLASQKNHIRTTAVNKECLRSHVFILAFGISLDYEPIPEELWQFFANTYGGGSEVILHLYLPPVRAHSSISN